MGIYLFISEILILGGDFVMSAGTPQNILIIEVMEFDYLLLAENSHGHQHNICDFKRLLCY